MKRPNMNVDHISEVPEFIIHQIMSYLPKRQVAQTSILSKKWHQMQKNYPVLDFSLERKNGANLRNFIYKSLHHFSQEKLGLKEFSVDLFVNDPQLFSDLDAWLNLVSENGVTELKLCNLSDLIELWDLPQAIFSCDTLRALRLYRFNLNKPLSTFRFLREISLECCRLNHPLYSKNGDWPFLEVLVLKNCFGFYGSLISNLPKLHTVKLSSEYDDGNQEEDRFIIEGESIQLLTICAHGYNPWPVININGCSSLKSLHLESENITDAEFHSLLFNFPLLEELFLSRCNLLETIQISGSRIKTLGLRVGYQSRLVCVGIEAPNLKNFIFIAHQKECVIKIADCCCNLTTLILHWRVITETVFHGLVSKFPLLENLWILGCNELERIQVQNPQLKRLHIVKCRRFKDVKYRFSNPNSGELYFKAYEEPKGWAKVEFSRNDDWWIRFDKFLNCSVGISDESVIEVIHRSLFLI